MNSNRIKTFFLLTVLSVVALPSCKNYLDINTDPTKSDVSRIDLQLSIAQVYTAIGIGQRINPTMGTWCQYHTGGPGVSLGDPDQHKLGSGESNEVFREMYRSANNLNYIVKNAPNESNYVAIAKLLQAYNFQVVADLFGDAPYTEALKGDIADGSILHPHYNSAKDVIYPAIEQDIKDALALIASPNGTALTPGNDDLIYQGDMAKWAKFGRTLLLKVYLRKGETDAAKWTALGSAPADFITDNADACAVPFPGGSTGSNPFWTAAKSTALGNFYVLTSTFQNRLNATQDPRIDLYFDKPGANHFSMDPGNVQNAPTSISVFSRPAGAAATTGGLMFGPTLPVILISAWEGNLLLAEAAARSHTSGDAKALYDAGVKASFAYLGAAAGADDTYLAGAGGYDSGNAIKSIALQKWVCMNETQNLESWIETRRFDNSSNPIFSSAGGIFKQPTNNALGNGIFPSILPYPENEESLNQNFPGPHDLTAKVFWDN